MIAGSGLIAVITLAAALAVGGCCCSLPAELEQLDKARIQVERAARELKSRYDAESPERREGASLYSEAREKANGAIDQVAEAIDEGQLDRSRLNAQLSEVDTASDRFIQYVNELASAQMGGDIATAIIAGAAVVEAVDEWLKLLEAKCKETLLADLETKRWKQFDALP